MSITYRRPTQAQLLRARRDALGLSKRQLAAAWGKSYAYVTGIEDGKEAITKPETVAALSEVIFVPVDDIYAAGGRLAPDLLDWLTHHPKLIHHLRAVQSQEKTHAD